MEYIIKKILKSDWQKYKNIRLEALKNEPSAFGSSYEEEFKRSDKEWQKRLEVSEQQNSDRFFYAISVNNKFFAIGGTYKDDRKEWNVMAIYTKKEFRGLGLGKKLMSGILNEFKKIGVKKVFLAVNTHQIAAIALYKKFDFKVINTIKNQLLGDGEYYDEFEMVKDLSMK